MMTIPRVTKRYKWDYRAYEPFIGPQRRTHLGCLENDNPNEDNAIAEVLRELAGRGIQSANLERIWLKMDGPGGVGMDVLWVNPG